jgi:DUF4097 and DUF4098 domain-containing protein YvlB
MAFPRSFPLVCLSSLLPMVAGCVVSGGDFGRYTERDEKRFTVDGKPDVVLSTFDGSIEIRSWDRPDVLVIVERRAATKEGAAAIHVDSEQQGNRVSVEVKLPAAHFFGLNWLGGGSARLIVSVPEASDVRATSGDGSIDLERVNGTIVLRSGDGSIHASNSSGNVAVSTGDGSIKLDDVDGVLDANTGDGSVRVMGKLTAVRARSGDGSIAVHAQPGSTASEDWTITSGDGSVTLELPDGFSADLDAHTGDGGIHLEGVTVSKVTGAIGRNNARGQLGSGGKSLRVRTGDGSITLRRSEFKVERE